MSSDTREAILAEARSTVQAHGYNGLSFRDLASAVGIKSASVHYHFPTKGDLGAALARGYAERARDDLEAILKATDDPAICLARYARLFRAALENGNRMCLCAILAAEADELPAEVLAEVQGFAAINREWLTRVLARHEPEQQVLADWAQAIFAAVTGAQLAARGEGDIQVFDATIAVYRQRGLIPA